MMGFLHKNNSALDASVAMNKRHKVKVKSFKPDRGVFIFPRLSIEKPEDPPFIKLYESWGYDKRCEKEGTFALLWAGKDTFWNIWNQMQIRGSLLESQI